MDQADADARAKSLVRDDRALVEACLDGDTEAWEALILRYQRLIYSIPIRSGFSPVDAADISVGLLEATPELATPPAERSLVADGPHDSECWR